MDFLRLSRREKRGLQSDKFKCFVSFLAADQSDYACDRGDDNCNDSSNFHVFHLLPVCRLYKYLCDSLHK